jgi:4-hydroxyproline epimerase
VTFPDRLDVVDSHTEGEPTRVVISGWPALRARDMAGRRSELDRDWSQLCRAVVCEPRGHDAVVGALLTEPVTSGAAAGVIFFNNVGTLGMCGHGLIGVVRTLAELGLIGRGDVVVDTPVGVVTATLGEDTAVTIRNVPAYAHALDVTVDVPGLGTCVGDIAYGGNWFFLTKVDVALTLDHVPRLLAVTTEIARALRDRGIAGAGGAVIDHIELTADDADADASVNFVLCPGGAYDRSPCGTGTSARLAVLHARGQLAPRTVWRQRSVTGGSFTAWLDEQDGVLHPFVRGRAWITARAELRFDENDPLRGGFTVSAP